MNGEQIKKSNVNSQNVPVAIVISPLIAIYNR